MHSMNRPLAYSGAATHKSSDSLNQAIAGSISAAAARKRRLTYQRGWSKHRMNVIRYNDTNTTHKKRSTMLGAGRLSYAAEAWSRSTVPEGAWRSVEIAVAAHSITKTA